jgi:hypothetical protein
MQDQPILDDATLDAAILWRLCEAAPWTGPELERELGLAAHDGVGRLIARGMARRTACGLIFPSASGRYAYELDASTP